MSYIDAEKLKEHILNYGKGAVADGYEALDPVDDIIAIANIVDFMPAADVVEIIHAYWEETTHITESKRGREIHSRLYNCSNCGAPNGRRKDSYCRWCGARMDGEKLCTDCKYFVGCECFDGKVCDLFTPKGE